VSITITDVRVELGLMGEIVILIGEPKKGKSPVTKIPGHFPKNKPNFA